MKFPKFPIVIILFACVGLSSLSFIATIKTMEEVDTFDAEIKGLTNMQKSQMEFTTLQATINQLGFCLQASQIENQELISTVKQTYQEVNLLRLNVQQMGMFIGGLLEDNSVLKERIQELEKGKST